MASKSATYAPGKLTIVIAQESSGIAHIVSGFSEDSIVQIERVAETYTMYTGADNFSTRTLNSNTSARITLSLQQSSTSNDILNALYTSDRNDPGPEGFFSIHIKDSSGRGDFFSDDAYVGVVPNSNYSNTVQTREWIIHAHDLQSVIGGNARVSPEDQATLSALGVTVDTRWV